MIESWKNANNEYKNICKNNNYNEITKIYCIYCIEESLKWLKRDMIETETERVEKAQVLYDYWLDTDIQISTLSDIICENWEKYVNDFDNFNIYDYID